MLVAPIDPAGQDPHAMTDQTPLPDPALPERFADVQAVEEFMTRPGAGAKLHRAMRHAQPTETRN